MQCFTASIARVESDQRSDAIIDKICAEKFLIYLQYHVSVFFEHLTSCRSTPRTEICHLIITTSIPLPQHISLVSAGLRVH